MSDSICQRLSLPYLPATLVTYFASSRICSSFRLVFAGICPMPLRMAFSTRTVSGRSSSRSGPTWPLASACRKVWQTAQTGDAAWVNRRLPSAIPSWALAVPAQAAKTLAQRKGKYRFTTQSSSGNGDLDRVVAPAAVVVAARILEAFFRLPVALQIDRTADKGIRAC